MALKINRPNLPPPEIINEDEPLPEIMESSSEIILEKLEEELYYEDNDDDDEGDTGMMLNVNNRLMDVLPISDPRNKKENDSQTMSAEAWRWVSVTDCDSQ